MALDFPSSPTNGQAYGGFVWNDANQTWDSSFAPRAATIPVTSPNYLINGAFEVNQRGFTSGSATGTYNFDRWYQQNNTGSFTASAQAFPPGSCPTGYEAANFFRMVVSGQSGAGAYAVFSQKIEDVRTLAGQTATISFWAKTASGTPSVSIELEQNFGSGGSPSVPVTGIAAAKISLTGSTAWTRYYVTVALPSIAGKTIGTNANTSSLIVNFWVSAGTDFNSRTNSLGIQANTFDFWGMQVESGAAPTDFRRNAPSIQGELAACQRYYFRAVATGAYGIFGSGKMYNPYLLNLAIQLPVTMRTAPSGAVEWTTVGSNYQVEVGATGGAITSVAYNNNLNSPRIAGLDVGTGPSYTTGAYAMVMGNNNSNAYFGFSAEL